MEFMKLHRKCWIWFSNCWNTVDCFANIRSVESTSALCLSTIERSFCFSEKVKLVLKVSYFLPRVKGHSAVCLALGMNLLTQLEKLRHSTKLRCWTTTLWGRLCFCESESGIEHFFRGKRGTPCLLSGIFMFAFWSHCSVEGLDGEGLCG